MKDHKLQIALLTLRISIFIVMLVWSLDKFIDPSHAAKVFSKFYFIDNLSELSAYIIGGLQILIVILFVVGLFKKWTYGAILIMHFISTISSYQMYIEMKLLFFAAFPMLAAIFTLFLLRDEDKLWVLSKG